MKSVCVLARRSDSSRAEFQRYYEERHAPLGIRHFPFTRYVRNHLLDAPDIGFDTMSEFWAEDISASAALMQGPVGEIMRADEERFMDRSRIAPAGAEEHVLSPGACTDDAGERSAVLIRREGREEAPFRDAVLAWAHDIAARTPGVSVDFAQSWQVPSFPADAVLWTPALPDEAPRALGEVRMLKVRRVETPPAQLLGRVARAAGADDPG